MAFAERKGDGKERLDVAIAELAATQFGLVTTAQIMKAGGSNAAISRRVAIGLLERVLPEIWRHRAFADSWEQKAMAAALWAGPGCALSHTSAAWIWGLSRKAVIPITLIVPHNLRTAKAWVVVKRVKILPRRDVLVRRALPVTTPSRTLLDLGSVVPPEAVEDALDAALHRGLVSVARMSWQLEMAGGKGIRGAARIRRLVEERDPGYRPTHSVLETAFRRLLKRHGFPQPSQQQVIYRGPAKKAIVDFLYPDIGLAIEVDGYSSHGHRAAWQSDLDRQNDLVISGLRVLRFTWDDVRHREGRVARQLRPFFGTQLSLSESDVEKNA